MTIFPIIQLYPIYTPTSKQSNKHILIVVKCLQLSTIILRVLLKLGADVKDSTLLQDCDESDINYSIDLVMIERTEST
jgi:hypothetical protein